jgi:hypothetical protein
MVVEIFRFDPESRATTLPTVDARPKLLAIRKNHRRGKVLLFCAQQAFAADLAACLVLKVKKHAPVQLNTTASFENLSEMSAHARSQNYA